MTEDAGTQGGLVTSIPYRETGVSRTAESSVGTLD